MMARAFSAALLLSLGAPAHAAEIDCFRYNSPSAAYISVESVDLQAKAGDRSSTFTTLSLGQRTCALTVTRVDGHDWAFVGGYLRDTDGLIRGWLPVDALAYRDQLKRHTNVRAQEVDVETGDYFGQYKVKTGGAFEVWMAIGEHKCRKGEVPNEYHACEDWAAIRGHFYGKGRLAIARSPKHSDLDVFKLLDDGRLCPWQYGNPPASCK